MSLEKQSHENRSSSRSSSSDIAVIGVGCMFPDAANLEEYWKNISSGHDAISPIPVSHWRPEDYFDVDPKKPDHTYAKSGGFLRPYAFDPLKYGIAPHAIEATDTTQLLGMVCAHEALVDAGYGPGKDFNRDKTSCIIGVTGAMELVIPLGARLGHPAWKRALKNAGVADDVAAAVVEEIAESYVPWQENSFPGLLGNVVAGRIASRLDLGGSNAVVDAACASSLAALHMAVMELESGRSDMVIAGGMDTFNDIFMYMCFSKTPALSPTGHSRPFDAEGDGTSIGEGLGAIILKRLSDAERDGDRIYAVLKGVGSGSDGKGQAIYAPAAKGQIKALTRAYELSGVDTNTIELFEAHGTGTKVGDGVEVEALSQVYGESEVKHCVIGSVKSQIGHTKAAAGAAGLIKAVMAIHHKIQPPTLKIRKLHPTLAKSPFQVLDQARPWITRGNHPRRAAISAFGFGGSNFHCVIEEYQKNDKPVQWDDETYLLNWSAASKDALLRDVSSTANLLQNTDRSNLQIIARKSRRAFKASDAHRLSVWAKGTEELYKRLESAVNLLKAGTTAAGVSYSDQPATKDIGLVFAGQGSQAPGMLRELMLSFPETLESLEAGSRILAESEGATPSLMDYIYPSQAFDDDKNLQRQALTATRIAQLALGTVGAALITILKRFGVKATSVAGHSYGELLALYAAGVLKLEDMLRASYQRGLLMEKAGRPGGGMLAVMASAERVEAVLKAEGFSAKIANYNAPEQVVVGGAVEELDRLKAVLKSLKITAKSLEVSTAFHTEYVSDAAETFDAWLKDNVTFHAAQLPVFSNKLAKQYEASSTRETLSAQLGAPVRFQDMLNAMRSEKRLSLVEIGPGRKIQGLLKANDPQALTLDSESKSSVLGLLALLAELSVLGVPLDLTQWNPGLEELPEVQKKSFTVTLTGANYRSEKKVKEKKETAKPLLIPDPSQKLPSPELSMKDSVKKPEPLAAKAQPSPVFEAPKVQSHKPVASAQPKTTSVVNHPAKSEASMKNNQEWSQLEHILKDMQEAQKRTTDAHTLFLENQRQFQQILRDALLGGADFSQAVSHEAPARSLAQAPVPRAPEAPRAQAQQYAAPVYPTPAAPAPRVQAAAAVSVPAPAPVPVQSQASTPAQAAPVKAKANAASRWAEILRIVGEATGFPVEMLSQDMHLESDLGIDSIKKVEIFSQLQSVNPGLQADASRMNEAQTIADLIAYVDSGSAPDLATAPVSVPSHEESAEDRKGAWSASPIAFVAGKASEIKQSVLAVISDKTGFPVEMLSDDMDLESDLGVDSIKKVEIFSNIQEKFPQVPFQAEALNELHKISDILNRINGGSSLATDDAAVDEGPNDLQAVLWEVIAEKTGYPAEVLTLQMDLESDLGIDSIKRVEILSALKERLPRIKDHASTEVRTLQDLLSLLQGGAIKTADDEGLAESLMNPEPMEWDLSSKKKSQDDEPLTSAESLKLSASKVSCWKLKASPFAFAGGQTRHQIKAEGEIWIVDDGSNLAKALLQKLEERGAHPKLVSQAGAERLSIPENLQGLYFLSPAQFDNQELRWLKNSYKLLRRCAESLQRSQGFVVTVSRHGGQFGLDGLTQLSQVYAGGTSAFIKTISHEWPLVHVRALDMGRDFTDSLEAATRCIDASLQHGPLEIGILRDRAYTLKLEEESFSEQSPEKVLKRGDTVLVTGGARGVTAATLIALAKRYPVRFVIWGRTALAALEAKETKDLTDAAAIKRQLLYLHPELSHPKDLEKAYRNILSQRELYATFNALRSYGAEVVYEVVDVSKEAELRSALQSLQDRYSVIKGVIHGAGVIRDKMIVDQNEDELAEVLDTKLRLLPFLENLAQQGTSWMVFFSSSTARLGRKGQGAYGLANEILNRAASYISSQYACRALALNWGPWDGGMVHDGLKKLFACEGLGTIPLETGASIQTYLLEHPSLGSGEWLVLGEGGQAILADQIIKQEKILAEKVVSVQRSPVLIDHVIKNRAVVPAALLVEWMIEAASSEFPGLVLKEVSKFQVWKGLVLDIDSELPIEIIAVSQSGNSMECVLRSRSSQGQLRPHAHAVIEFARDYPPSDDSFQAVAADPELSAVKPYEGILFHGESLHLIKEVRQNSEDRLVADLTLFGEASDWDSEQSRWFAQAPLLDAIFQGAILWTSLSRNSRCLPSKFAKARYYQAWSAQDATLDLAVESLGDHRLMAHAKVYAKDGSLIAEVEGFEATLDASLAESFSMNELASLGSNESNV
jgi:acyl transferase domain-containing protein/NAD(P)-dependent dehydrogenase (short-subunit alcohol dehydrogenase family)